MLQAGCPSADGLLHPATFCHLVPKIMSCFDCKRPPRWTQTQSAADHTQKADEKENCPSTALTHSRIFCCVRVPVIDSSFLNKNFFIICGIYEESVPDLRNVTNMRTDRLQKCKCISFHPTPKFQKQSPCMLKWDTLTQTCIYIQRERERQTDRHFHGFCQNRLSRLVSLGPHIQKNRFQKSQTIGNIGK